MVVAVNVSCQAVTSGPFLPEVVAHQAKRPIGVVLLSVQSPIVHDVLEGVVHQTTSTAGVLALQEAGQPSHLLLQSCLP